MEDNADEKAISTQQKLQASHDPGWNDPPKWAYTPTQSNETSSTPTKRLLNKRVAFPLNSAVSAQSSPHLSSCNSPTPPNLPPPVQYINLTTAPHAPMLAPSNVSIDSTVSKQSIDKEKALNDSLINLYGIMNEKLLIKDNVKREEIQKRLDVMKIMWQENKLSDQVQGKIVELSNALKENDIENADKLHMNLMMNHTTLCSSWIPAIRHLILELKAKLNVECISDVNDRIIE